MRTLPALTLAAIALGATGCPAVAIVDDVDFELNFTPIVGPSDALHAPYVVGSSMNLYLETQSVGDTRRWTIESTDPAIFTVDPPQYDSRGDFKSARGHALAPGVATLRVIDDGGSVRRSIPITVAIPSTIAIDHHGPLLVERPELRSDWGDGRIVVGGTSTYLASYFDGPDRLSGNGALSARVTSGRATVDVVNTYLFEDRDWLQVTPTAAGPFTVELMVGGQVIRTLEGIAVPASEVADVRIYGEDESKARAGEWLVALAVATDAQGRIIWGVEYKWDLDGQSEPGMGDLYRYPYDPKKRHMVAASFGQLSAVAMIHGGNGFVDSTNRVGCSAAPGTPSRGATATIVLGLLLLAFGLRRRLR
jgi:uncharacterized protein (TIGR03382 family)